jgi:MFS family permease
MVLICHIITKYVYQAIYQPRSCYHGQIMTTQKTIYGFIVWLITTLFVVYAFCLNTAAAVFSDAIKTTLHASNLSLAMASGSFILGYACMQIPAGYLLDRFNIRMVVSASIFLLALGNLTISYSDNVIIYSLSNFMQGLGASFSFVAAAVLISQWFPKKTFPILLGLSQTISCVLTSLIHYYFMLALKTHAWNDLYRGLAVFGFSLFIFSLLFVKSPANYKQKAPMSFIKALETVFTNKQIMLCAIAIAFSFGTILSYAGFWFIEVEKAYSIETLETVIISGMIFIGIGIGTPLWGWLSNSLKTRTQVIHASLVLGTMALLLAIYLPHFNIETLIIIKTVSFLTGFLLSGSMLFYTIVNEISSDNIRGLAMSVLNTAVFLMNTILLFLPYLFITTYSTQFFTYLWVLPFCVMISILLTNFIKDT